MLEENDTTATEQSDAPQEQESTAPQDQQPATEQAAQQGGQRRSRQRRSASRPAGPPATLANPFLGSAAEPDEEPPAPAEPAAPPEPARPMAMAVFQVPQLPVPEPAAATAPAKEAPEQAADEPSGDGAPRRRSRNRRGKSGDAGQSGEQRGDAPASEPDAAEPSTPGGDAADSGDTPAEGGGSQPSSTKKRRRRKRGSAADADGGSDDPNTVTKVRGPKQSDQSEKVSGVKGSTRLEAKKQRRREGREAGRRRAPILSEAEFLARRESVDRGMVVRQLEDVTQIAVLEDGVLVEHYVTKDSGAPATMVGNVYLGRVQNVLPSMEAAFVDIGRGRNAVLYAGEVNWDAAGLDGQPKRIEFALKSGDPVLVQVTKDPIGHKGARLTSQVSLPGRYLVFVPDGSMTGISRKLPDTERSRLRGILKRIVPDDVGVIVRTAAEGASEEELQRDVTRLAKAWAEIQRKAGSASPPQLLHAEPELAIRVVRDLFNEDFGSLQVSGDRAWLQIKDYVDGVAPDLSDRLSKWSGTEDAFTNYRIDEQLAKALDRKVWLPSGGSLIIEHTEAMTVIDVNTGKFTGQGGDLEETVTQNNLEAAEEIVRQVRLRDIGGIIVIDFIDMVLEGNRDLVLRRLVECLGRDRTKHQVTEITSLGLAQMTRKRIGGGLLETFSETCEACNGRGVRVTFDAQGAPGNGRRKTAKPQGAHDPIETMQKGTEEEEDTAGDNAAESAEDVVGATDGEPAAADASADGGQPDVQATQEADSPADPEEPEELVISAFGAEDEAAATHPVGSGELAGTNGSDEGAESDQTVGSDQTAGGEQAAGSEPGGERAESASSLPPGEAGAPVALTEAGEANEVDDASKTSQAEGAEASVAPATESAPVDTEQTASETPSAASDAAADGATDAATTAADTAERDPV